MVEINISEILRLLPHRYPFLLVDKVLSVDPGKSIVALKNVTYNEHFFPGHFPTLPVMPGVLIIEALAQACGILAYCSKPNHQPLYFLAGVDRARFRRIVSPGEQLIFNINFIKEKRQFLKYDCKSFVESDLVCSCELLISPKKEDSSHDSSHSDN